ncbi:Ppx/GppA phosphatase family protein [Actinotignum sp. GS-2025c]|uniref:Ppx/GppA phosphatase family protein n=1 Tax=Actinotignum sp. GS-2025c TaxID=3427276 RepID=UPI003F456743
MVVSATSTPSALAPFTVPSQRVAGIDCGTNSIRLLIADVPGTDGSSLSDITRQMEIVYLGQGVDATGHFAPEALERTLNQVDIYARLCREAGVTSIRFAATSATRDAANRAEFLDGVMARLGVRPQVLTGAQEAQTSFSGAISALSSPTSPVLLIDLGGGSTELVLGHADGSVIASRSMDIGSVRMRERHLRHDPPTPTELENARADIRAALDEAEKHVPLGKAEQVVGVAGTVTSVTATWLGLDTYDSAAVHGTAMPLASIEKVTDWFIHAPLEERAALGFMHPGRAPVIGAGALVWQEVVRRIAERRAAAGRPLATITTSEHDILDGLALWAAREPQPPARPTV